MHSKQYIKVAVHGVPRSGTSWIGEILNSSPNTIYRYQPLFSYAHKDYLSNASTREDIDSFFEELLHCDDEFTNQVAKRASGDFPIFKKKQITHIVYKEVRYINILFNLMRRAEDVFLCGVMRNPLSVINSWLLAPKEFRRDLGWSESEEWRYALKKNLNKPEEFHGYEKWKEAANTFINLKKQYPNRVYIQKYSDMLKNPLEESKKLFDFCEIEFTNTTVDFLRNSTSCDNTDAYAVFRSRQSDYKWKAELLPEISEQILTDLKGTHFEDYVEQSHPL
ncbi:MAG: sulfotransferase domain-containing protein [Desulfobacteraceae bacterium]|nr:sulfotransferase domain-containing protein [Desulfobacteraceae bacterium]MBC2718832.1 sulfotransferase domain-containing protein [Desulfobacteraceae bacterium]